MKKKSNKKQGETKGLAEARTTKEKRQLSGIFYSGSWDGVKGEKNCKV